MKHAVSGIKDSPARRSPQIGGSTNHGIRLYEYDRFFRAIQEQRMQMQVRNEAPNRGLPFLNYEEPFCWRREQNWVAGVSSNHTRFLGILGGQRERNTESTKISEGRQVIIAGLGSGHR